MYFFIHTNGLSLIFIVFIFLPWGLGGDLHCHRCLAISCPESSDDNLCTSSRDYIVQQLRDYYYIGDYLEPCPEPDNGVAWRTMEIYNEPCEAEQRSHATCVLGRMELVTSNNATTSKADDNLVIHATVLGCGRRNLLEEMRKAKIGNNCSYIQKTNRYDRRSGDNYVHELELEHCPNLSDYCIIDHCVSGIFSVVKPFRSQSEDASFEYGTVITIIVVIVVIFLAVIAAALCRFPISHASNYSPTLAQEEASTVTSVRSINDSM